MTHAACHAVHRENCTGGALWRRGERAAIRSPVIRRAKWRSKKASKRLVRREAETEGHSSSKKAPASKKAVKREADTQGHVVRKAPVTKKAIIKKEADVEGHLHKKAVVKRGNDPEGRIH